jgi:hypothetical protein
MSTFTEPYSLEQIDADTANWEVVYNSNFSICNTNMCRLLAVPGSIVDYQAVNVETDGTTGQARSNSMINLPAIGIVLNTVGSTQLVVCNGEITNSGWSWTRGDIVYVSGLTLGEVTQIKPGTSLIQVIGWASDTDKIWVNPGPVLDSGAYP